MLLRHFIKQLACISGVGGGCRGARMTGFSVMLLCLCCSEEKVAWVLSNANGTSVFGGVLVTTENVSVMVNGSLASSRRDCAAIGFVGMKNESGAMKTELTDSDFGSLGHE